MSAESLAWEIVFEALARKSWYGTVDRHDWQEHLAKILASPIARALDAAHASGMREAAEIAREYDIPCSPDVCPCNYTDRIADKILAQIPKEDHP